MEWLILIGCFVAAWMVLRIVGGERERRLGELERAAKKAQEQAGESKQVHA
jgi:hypothetical protein